MTGCRILVKMFFILSLLVCQLSRGFAENLESDFPQEDVLELSPVIVTGNSGVALLPSLGEDLSSVRDLVREEHITQPSLERVLSAAHDVQFKQAGTRLHHQSFSVRGVSSKDVLVTYLGIPLNDLANSGVDLSFIHPALLSGAELTSTFGSQASGFGNMGSVLELSSNIPKEARILVNYTFPEDVGVFGQVPVHAQNMRMSLAVFGDVIGGEFLYKDLQGTEQKREHNGAKRFGGQWQGKYEFDSWSIYVSSFYSRIFREEAGPSEFPEAFKYATSESQWSLSKIEAEAEPFIVGSGVVFIAGSMAHRFAEYDYSNPTALMGGRPTSSLYRENRTIFTLNSGLLLGESLTKAQLLLERQNVKTEAVTWVSNSSYDKTQYVVSLFLSEQISFNNKFELYAGLRFELVSDNGTAWLPRAAFSCHLFDWMRLSMAIAYTERRPALDELFLSNEFIRGNRALQSQRALLAEVSLDFSLDSWLTLRASSYINYYWNLIRFLPMNLTQYEARNLPLARAVGFDLSMDSALFSWMKLRLGYSFVDARMHVSRLPIPGISKHKLTAGSFLEFDPWKVSVELEFLADRYVNFIQKESHNPLLLGIQGSYQIGSSWLVSVQLHNLLNDKRRTDFIQRPLPGFQASLSVQGKF